MQKHYKMDSRCLVLAFILAISTTSATELDSMTNLAELYGGTGEPSPEQNNRFFETHGKILYEQASVLNSMALAKTGDEIATRKRLKMAILQTLYYDLSGNGLVGELGRLLESDRTFFYDTIEEGQRYQDTISDIVQQKQEEFAQGSKTDEDKQRIKNEIRNAIRDQAQEQRTRFQDAWINDNTRIQRQSTTKARAKVLWGDMRQTLKRIKVPPNSPIKLGPLTDIVHLIMGGHGLAEAIAQNNVKGIVKSSVGIIGATVALGLFAAGSAGVTLAATVAPVVGLLFYIAGMFIQAIWPSNTAIETANKLSKYARDEINGFSPQLQHMAATGGTSFGWLYQSNTGVLLLRGITPNTPITFRQATCASPCDPAKRQYENKPYLVLGTQRRSTDSRQQFQLDMTYDFIGVPTEAKFCGNTILVNTGTYHRALDKLPASYRRGTGYYHRSIIVDTKATPPSYNDVNMDQWDQRSDKRHKIRRRKRRLPDGSSDRCQPNSDRILIEELEIMNHNTGKARINTGDGNDVLTIPSWIMVPDNRRTDVLVADLGSGNNLLSLGSTISLNRERSQMLAGVIFDNTGGIGHVCYLKLDLRTKRCIGTVRGVKVFEGSRLHDTVVMGADGPFTVIQNHGANEYVLDSDDLYHRHDEENPYQFEIMDVSGNRPKLTIRCGTSATDVQLQWNEGRWSVTVTMETSGVGRAVANVVFTGIFTEPDVFRKDTGGSETCIG